jgi:hypothetical protein
MPKFLTISSACVIAAAWTIILLAQGRIESNVAYALGIGIILLAVVLNDIVTSKADGLNLCLNNVSGLYGGLYALYYLAGLVVFALRYDTSKNNIIEVSFLILLGYLGCRLGVALSGNRPGPSYPPFWGRIEAKSAYLLCWIGFGMVLAGYAYKASVGAFFTHGASFAQGTSIRESLLNNFTFPFEFPVVLLAGLLSASPFVKKRATVSMWIFTGVFVLIHLLAGEFRTIVSDFVMLIAALQSSRGFRLTWQRIAVWLCVILAAFLLIQRARLVASVEHRGSLGVRQSAGLVLKAATTPVANSSYQMSDRASDRAANGPRFLSNLIGQVDSGYSYIYGRVMLVQLSSLLPRMFWPDKPVFSSTQIALKREFGLPLLDDAPGALSSYYAFGGPIAVFFWLMMFGLLLGSVQRRVQHRYRILPWLLLIWTIGSVVDIEDDQLICLLTGLRHFALSYMIFLGIQFFYRHKATRRSIHIPAQVGKSVKCA